MMLGAKAPDYDTGLLRAYALSQASKHSKSAHFSAKNGYFLMFWAGQVVKTPLTSKLASEFCLFDPGIIIKLGIVAQIFKYVPGCIWKGMQSGIFYAQKELEIFLKNCYKIHKSLFGITEIPEENPSVEECWNLLTNGRTSAIIPVMQKTPASKYNF